MRADAVEMSSARLVDGVASSSSAKITGSLGPRASQNPALAETARRAPELLSLSRRALVFSLSQRSESATAVNLTWDRGHAALIELDDPRTLNALTENALRSLFEALSLALASRSVRALVLRAAGPHFCTGGRYEKNKLAQAPPQWWAKARGTCGSGHVLEQIRAAPVSSFSVLHGSSIGGGLLLGLTADCRVATENATFRLGVAPYGLSPVVMATEVLPVLVGQSYSTRMYVEDVMLDAREAVGAGVSSHVRPDSETARHFAQ